MNRNKFNAAPVQHDGIKFDSQAERDVYVWLKSRQDAGEIVGLTCQPHYELQPAFVDSDGKRQRPISYAPDFCYEDALSGQAVAVEVKGGKATNTQASRLRQKLFRYKFQDIRFELVEV